MILTDIGEIGVYHEGRELFLRPSLYAMSRLGTKEEIFHVLHEVMQGDLAYSLAVLQVCSDGDIRDIFGYIDQDSFEFVGGEVSEGEIVILAQSLLKHGIIGDIDRSEDPPIKESEYSKEFDAKSYVAIAMAHLGVSERDAWQMTMTSLAGALRAKYPPVKNNKDKLPTLEEVAAIDDWVAEVNKLRD